MPLDLLKRSEKPAGIENALTTFEHDTNLTAIENAVNTLESEKADASALGGAAALNVGTTAGTVAAGDDSRFDAIPENVVQSDVTGITGADAVANLVSLTQAEYDAIGVKDADTVYVITDAAPADPLTVASGMSVVNHAADANVARPGGAAAVYWIGTVEPVNAADGDLWIGGV